MLHGPVVNVFYKQHLKVQRDSISSIISLKNKTLKKFFKIQRESYTSHPDSHWKAIPGSLVYRKMSQLDTLPEPEVQLGEDPSKPWEGASPINCDLERNRRAKERGREEDMHQSGQQSTTKHSELKCFSILIIVLSASEQLSSHKRILGSRIQ